MCKLCWQPPYNPDTLGDEWLQASSDGTCRVWNTATGTAQSTLLLTHVIITPKYAMPATISGVQEATLRASGRPVMCVDFGASLVVGGSNDKLLWGWDAETERARVKLAGHAGKIYAVHLLDDGRRVVWPVVGLG